MENLWAPWRMDYILGKREAHCIFCPEAGGKSDEERLILHRGKLVMVMMNRFPYNNGHLLAAPWRHVACLDELTDEEMLGLMKWTRNCTLILKKVMHPDGFNVGLNIGKEAGAGIAEHLHFHIVPRWAGDTSFMTVFDEIRSIPEHIQQTYSKLLPHFRKESANEDV